MAIAPRAVAPKDANGRRGARCIPARGFKKKGKGPIKSSFQKDPSANMSPYRTYTVSPSQNPHTSAGLIVNPLLKLYVTFMIPADFFLLEVVNRATVKSLVSDGELLKNSSAFL